MKAATRILLALSLVGSACLTLASEPVSAEKAIEEAGVKAKAAKKNILVIFHASWCGWCKQLDKFLASAEMKPIFDENFVTVHLVVREPEENKPLENPGAPELMSKLGGKDAGLPFFAILKPDGTSVITSMRPVNTDDKSENIGYPKEEHEIAHFLVMLDKGAPRLTAAERAKIKEALTKKGQFSFPR